MKTPLTALLLGAALLAAPACSSKKEDAAPVVVEPTPSTTLTNYGRPVTASYAFSISPLFNAITVCSQAGSPPPPAHQAGLQIAANAGGPATSVTIYYQLSGPVPGGTIVAVPASLPSNNSPERCLPGSTGTLTGRKLVINGAEHLYLSGTWSGSLQAAPYVQMALAFTDIKAY